MSKSSLNSDTSEHIPITFDTGRGQANAIGAKLISFYTGLLKHLIYKKQKQFVLLLSSNRPPLWSSGQSLWLQIQRSRVRFPALPDFLSSSGSGTGSTQPREVN